MFKNKEKEIIFYNSSNNTYRQVFKEELNDNIEDVVEGYLDEFQTNEMQIHEILRNQIYSFKFILKNFLKSLSITVYLLSILAISLVDMFLTRGSFKESLIRSI